MVGQIGDGGGLTNADEKVLQGWKQIASFVSRDVRTVRRWEKDRGLPVHRVPGEGRPSVFAVSTELQRWMRQTPTEIEPAPVAIAAPASSDFQTSEVAAEAPLLVPPRPVAGSSRRFMWLSLSVVASLATLLVAARREYRTGEAAPSAHARAIYVSPVKGVDDLYLSGVYLSEQRTAPSLAKAERTLMEAVDRDPGDAPAWAALAKTYNLLREFSPMPSAEAYPKAAAAARRALSLDPDLADAHASLAFVDFFWTREAQVADQEFRRALVLDPTSTLAHHWYGSMLTHQSRFAEALTQLDDAQRLEPASTPILISRAYVLGLSGRRDEARAMLKQVSENGPNAPVLHQRLATLSLMQPSDVNEFLRQQGLVDTLYHNTADAEVDAKAHVRLRAEGEHAMWRDWLKDERALHPDQCTIRMAELEAILARWDRPKAEDALRHLEELDARHDPMLVGMTFDPFFVELREEPRFIHIERDMGLVSTPR